MEDGLLRTIAEICGATLMSAGGFLLKRSNSRLVDIERRIEQDRTSLADYKLVAEQRFAKEETMQSSLSRIHDRLDDVINILNGNHHPR